MSETVIITISKSVGHFSLIVKHVSAFIQSTIINDTPHFEQMLMTGAIISVINCRININS